MIGPLVEGRLSEEAQASGTSIEDAEAALLKENRSYIVVGRLGDAEETAAVVAFLASERASFVHRFQLPRERRLGSQHPLEDRETPGR